MADESSQLNRGDMPDDEINLLELWQVIWKRRKLIIRIVLIVVLVTAISSLFMTNIYQSSAVITPVSNQGGGGTMAALAQQFGGLAGMTNLDIAMPGASSASDIMNLLKSNILRQKVIEQHNLLPILFYKDWDEKQKKWKKEEGGISLNPMEWMSSLVGLFASHDAKKKKGIPDNWDALRLFDDIVDIKNDIKGNKITISVSFHDPEMAAKIVEYFISTLTDHMSSEAKRVAETNRKYLESQLIETSDPFIKQKIYNLIAQQIETAMIAEVKENFAFKVIDPPKVPDKKIKPKRTMIVLLSLFVALFMGIFVAFFLEYLEKARSQVSNGQIAKSQGGLIERGNG
ncbi:MAG: Wzz/FepE/Etk N-terminal domain-containing protein [Syntrophales bacterium]